MRRRTNGGRYLVADKSCPSYGAALAYAGTLASRLPQPGTVYVRVPGQPAAIGHAERDRAGIVHLITNRKER